MKKLGSKAKSFEIDMCNGPLLGKILLFSIPLMLSGVLQLLFNAADIVVVGRFAGHEALAAVGSTGALINLLINVFIGLSVGTNVMTAHFYGAKMEEKLSDTVHTAIAVSLVCGTFLIFVGLLLAKPLLTLMGTPADVLNQAALYMRIYFAGMPIIMLYNFGSAVLRAIGDTRRPLYYLMLAGAANVLMNLFFVIVLHLGVAGVALATVLSQFISAGLVLVTLMRSSGAFRLDIHKLKIHPDLFKTMLRIGLPAGLQGAIFSISNVLIQSSINSFGSVFMAGNTAASNIEGFVYTAMNSFHQTALSFTSQNYGAGKTDRINKTLILCIICVSITGLSLGLGAYALGPVLLSIYSSDAQVIAYGVIRLGYVCAPYFLCGIMDVMVGSLRGMGYSIMPMLVSLSGACLLRIIWIFTVFQIYHTPGVLYMSYPITWTVTALAHILCFFIVKNRQRQKRIA